MRSYSSMMVAVLSYSGVYLGQLSEQGHRDVSAVPHWKLYQCWQTDSVYTLSSGANYLTAWCSAVL